MKGDKKNKAGPGTHTKGGGGVLNVTRNSVAPAPYVGQAQRLWVVGWISKPSATVLRGEG